MKRVTTFGLCHLCGAAPATEGDHLGVPRDDGPLRGYLCHPCNLNLTWAERVGAENIFAYLTACAIGPSYTEHKRWMQRVRYARDMTDPAKRAARAACALRAYYRNHDTAKRNARDRMRRARHAGK